MKRVVQMDLTVFIIFGIIIALMIVMSVFLLNGKGAFLIAGYNTMSKKRKALYDEKAMCRFAGALPPMKKKHMPSTIRTTINSTSPMCRCSSRVTWRAAPERTPSTSCR